MYKKRTSDVVPVRRGAHAHESSHPRVVDGRNWVEECRPFELRRNLGTDSLRPRIAGHIRRNMFDNSNPRPLHE